MKKIVYLLLSACLFSCTGTQHFGKRKYLKGRFTDSAEQYATNQSEQDSNSKTKAALFSYSIKQDSTKTNTTTASLHSNPSKKAAFLRNKKTIASRKPELKTPFLFSLPSDSLKKPLYKRTDTKTQSDISLIFGMLSFLATLGFLFSLALALVGYLSGFVPLMFLIASIVLTIISLVYAQKVIRSPEATDKEKKQANAGKIVGLLSAFIVGSFFVLLILLAILLR